MASRWRVRETYGRLSPWGRGQVWMTIGYWAFCGVSLAAVDDPLNPIKGGPLVTWPNIFASVGLLITAGTVWQQWKDAQGRLTKLEAALVSLKEEHLPDTYVRRDLFEEKLKSLGVGIAHGLPPRRKET